MANEQPFDIPPESERLRKELEEQENSMGWEAELIKAKLYRAQWDAKIAYRGNQLRRYAGQPSAFKLLWENWRIPYSPENYLQNTDAPGEQGGYITPFDWDTNGAISSSPIRLKNTRHASDQNDHPYPID